MLILSEHEVAQLLDLTELRNAMEAALISLSAGGVVQPLRSILPIPVHGGWFGQMCALYGDVIGSKLVTVFPGNAKLGLHTHHATIHLFKAETGEPMAIIDGRLITALRTAAVSALASRELADPGSRVLAILGSGVQARAHYHALSLVRTFHETRIWSRSPQHAEELAKELGARAMSAEGAVTGADVVVTATAAKEPILRGTWLKDGAHVNAVGAVGLHARELDDTAMRDSTVFVESRAAALAESAEITTSGATIFAELGELLAGTKSRGRSRITVYKGLGVAVEDVAAAKLVYEKAVSASYRCRTRDADALR